jgi:hypothetical protein
MFCPESDGNQKPFHVDYSGLLQDHDFDAAVLRLAHAIARERQGQAMGKPDLSK